MILIWNKLNFISNGQAYFTFYFVLGGLVRTEGCWQNFKSRRIFWEKKFLIESKLEKSFTRQKEITCQSGSRQFQKFEDSRTNIQWGFDYPNSWVIWIPDSKSVKCSWLYYWSDHLKSGLLFRWWPGYWIGIQVMTWTSDHSTNEKLLTIWIPD